LAVLQHRRVYRLRRRAVAVRGHRPRDAAMLTTGSRAISSCDAATAFRRGPPPRLSHLRRLRYHASVGPGGHCVTSTPAKRSPCAAFGSTGRYRSTLPSRPWWAASVARGC